MRRFYLERFEDATGISGTGIVAEGVEFDTGDCVLCWMTPTSSIGVYKNIKAVKAIHGHGGLTKVRWFDEDDHPNHEADPVPEESKEEEEKTDETS